MSMRIVSAAIESIEFGLDDTTSMDCTQLCRACRNGNHKTTWFHQVKSIAIFIRTRNRSFSYWRGGKAVANDEQPRQQDNYQQGRNHRGRWSIYSLNWSPNRDPTSTRGPSKKENRASTNYIQRSGPLASDSSYKNSSYAARSGL